MAAGRSQYDTADILLSNGVDINATSRNGLSALGEACEATHYRIVGLSVRKSADISEEDMDGLTPFQLLFGQNDNNLISSEKVSVNIMVRETSRLFFGNLPVSASSF